MKEVSNVKIRMYRQGLGDCFLLTFNEGETNKFHFLIDCGVLSKAKIFEDKMNVIATNIREVTDGKIDVLVATHEHWDHLSGFLQAKKIFDKMEINEIWMAWTENPEDTFASKLKANQKSKLSAINTAVEKLKNQVPQKLNLKQKLGHKKYLKAFNAFFNFYGMDSSADLNVFTLAGISDTAKAFDTLRKRKNSTKVYLTPNSNEVIELKKLPGVRIYVLGPPKDDKALKKMNPSKKKSELYELAYKTTIGESFSSALEKDPDFNLPFNESECINEIDARLLYRSYFQSKEAWRKIDYDWLYSAGNLAIALDTGVNNTSLALAFEFIDSGKVLLFPADAQIGNWLSWKNYEWNVKNNGEKEVITIDDLLARTVFYKVGHHGSHNATLRDQGLEKMINNELIAMIPVNQKMATSRSWKMPFKPLREVLNDKTKGKVIIQDEEYPDSILAANKTADGVTELYFDVLIHNNG